VVVDGSSIHFYEQRSMKDSPLGDVQKVDMGIALVHFDLVAQEAGFKTHFAQADPGIDAPEDCEYIVTYEVAR
ncbi:MAG: nitroreductase, partial [Eggerthellaceae bacterium]|nr:nitroreductase [Eggerthellaceae bacterium]